jgi:hypothetical protein
MYHKLIFSGHIEGSTNRKREGRNRMFTGIAIGLVLLYWVFIIIGFVLWLWMLIDCITKEPSEGNDKIIWLLVIIFLGPLGALIYLLARRPKRKQQYGR